MDGQTDIGGCRVTFATENLRAEKVKGPVVIGSTYMNTKVSKKIIELVEIFLKSYS